MASNLVILFFELMLAILLGALIGAVVLQLSCALYNLLAGVSGKPVGPTPPGDPGHALKSDEDWAQFERITMLPGVPRPRLDQAMLIVFFATLVNAPATFIIFRLLRVAGQAAGYSVRASLPVACVALPMGILVLAGINAAMLPTRFGKGLLVSLLSHVLALILGLVLFAVIVLIVYLFGLRVFGGFRW